MTIDPGDASASSRWTRSGTGTSRVAGLAEVDPELDSRPSADGPGGRARRRGRATRWWCALTGGPREWGVTYPDEGTQVWALDIERATGTDDRGAR